MEEDGKISLPKPEKDETVVARLFGISSDTETAAGSFAVPRCFY